MQCFIVVASLVSELAGGVKMTPLSPYRFKKHLSPLRVKWRTDARDSPNLLLE